MPELKEEPLGYSVKEAMRIARMGRTKFYGLIKRREIRTRRIGRTHFIPRAELERLLSLPEDAA
jgi:excisionase family DNA binding protein